MRYNCLNVRSALGSLASTAPSQFLTPPKKSAKSFPCRTSEKRAHNSFVCRTYKIIGLKVLYLPHIRKNLPPLSVSVNQVTVNRTTSRLVLP